MLFTRYSRLALVAMLFCAAGRSQEPSTPDPRQFGLEIPAGPLASGEKQAVTTTDEDGQPVVGRVHVLVGRSAVVLLPDGQLVGRREGQFSPTDRKFAPLDKDDLVKRLAAEFPGFKAKATSHYVYVYNSSDEFQFGTSRILETMLPGVKAWA